MEQPVSEREADVEKRDTPTQPDSARPTPELPTPTMLAVNEHPAA